MGGEIFKNLQTWVPCYSKPKSGLEVKFLEFFEFLEVKFLEFFEFLEVKFLEFFKFLEVKFLEFISIFRS